MRGPNHQAKLVLFALLKTAAAFATPSSTKAASAQIHHHAATSSHNCALYYSAAAAAATTTASNTAFRTIPPPTKTTSEFIVDSPPVTTNTARTTTTTTTTTTTPATTASKKNQNNKQQTQTKTQLLVPTIQLRLANQSDVASMNECNFRTLPENYNYQFYQHHINEWPELAFVVVVDKDDYNACTVTDTTTATHHPYQSTNLQKRYYSKHINKSLQQSNYDDNYEQFSNNNSIVVGYLLGKVMDRPTIPTQYQNNNNNNNNLWNTLRNPSRTSMLLQQQLYQSQKAGHISSLAVLPEFRRLGLAKQLMEQFHTHLQQHTNAQSSGLHCRIENTAAVRLYTQFGYEPIATIPNYYEDGENAYYMQKTVSNSNTGKQKSYSRFLFNKQNKQLPRIVVNEVIKSTNIDDDMLTPEDCDENLFLTGTM